VVHVFSASYWSFVLNPTPAVLLAKLYGKKVVLKLPQRRSGGSLAALGAHGDSGHAQADALVVCSAF